MTDPTTNEALALDTSVPHSARIWNYWLGGKDHYAIDRETGDEILRIAPGMITYARADRAFLGRAVRYVAEEAGIRQFLDIGTGLPTVDNTHEVAQRVAPDSRVVYVDNDPLVLAHARALLTSTPEGATDYLHADLEDPDLILDAAARTLDFGRPVAIMLLGVVNYVADDGEAHSIVKRLLDAVPSGSHLVLSHTSVGPGTDEAVEHWNQHGTPKLTQRTKAQVAELFTGLELVEPGVVACSHWRPEATPWGEPEEVHIVCGVGRKL
ncbi:SAM-dependent methyltransferase [Streptomyces litchfieldiae]|uniref:SAM-dependent methyltransferase n=1 Tax=Streptomyces litchfieldiae TaxID=3075543 RepID=A0ABU2MRD4_9ACTN|nr:SAM-dependent methyltransferase [Streptomyces sp. DSM 44938]MDT0344085.1 SAM-dependent methyltransferase [Streptomyces sp. DSM 44938]